MFSPCGETAVFSAGVGAVPQIVKELQNALAVLFQPGRAGLGEKQPAPRLFAARSPCLQSVFKQRLTFQLAACLSEFLINFANQNAFFISLIFFFSFSLQNVILNK